MIGGCFLVVTVTQGKAYVPLSLRTSVRLGMGGFCTRRGGCNTISPLVSTATKNAVILDTF